jgi:hypothetical protein
MRVSILVPDNKIYIDGEVLDTDCSSLLAKNINAVQWLDSDGWIEYAAHKKPNDVITDFDVFQQFIDTATKPAMPEMIHSGDVIPPPSDIK